MALATLDWIIIVGFLLLILVVGLSYTARAGKNISSFFLGGRNLHWFIAGISMVATTFAADTPLAVTELVASGGIAGNWLWWNFLLGGMLTTFFFARLWRKADIVTEVELIELRYDGKPAALLRGFKAVYLGLFLNVLIIGWVNVALMSLLEVFFNIPRSEAVIYTIGAMLFVAIYSSLSGLIGVAITDLIQFTVAITGSIILAVLVVNSESIGGIEGLKAGLPEGSMDFFPAIKGAGEEFGTALTIGIGAFLAHIGIQWWASWYPGAEPGGGGYIVQRMMSTKNEKHAIYSTLFFQIAHYCLRPWPWILVGLCAIILYPELPAADKKLGYVLAMRDYLPVGLTGLLLAAFFAAYMSTISTQLNWGASYVVNDFYHRFIEPHAKQKKLVLVSRITTLVIMVLGGLVTELMTSISGVWQFIIECGAGLGLVLILRWYWWRINAWSEIAATITPFIIYGTLRLIDLYSPPETVTTFTAFPNSFFITVGGTTIVWLLVTWLTPPTNFDKLENFYKQVRPGGAWKPVQKSLGLTPAKAFSNMGGLVACWVSAIVFTYSVLFFTGKIIFQEWQDALVWGGVGLISLSILIYFVNKTRIFADE